MTSRRAFLGAVGVSALGATGFVNLLLRPSSAQTGVLVRSRVALPRPYQVPLPIPAVLQPTSTSAGADHYLVRQRAVVQEILPGLKTPILGYEGTFPGPTVVARSGRAIVVVHRNELAVPTVVHLHGGHTPAASDGFPTDVVLPVAGATASGHSAVPTPSAGSSDRAGHTHDMTGSQPASGSASSAVVGSREYAYPMTQRAATLWYHDHRMDHTARQVYHGLAGFHLVQDDDEAALPLPTGDRDIPLMITDRAFEEDGSFRYPDPPATMEGGGSAGQPAMGGVLADVILVNGAPWPVLEVNAARYRLRLLNASNARRYLLRFAPMRTPFVQIGSDAGLLSRPVELTDIDIAQGERYDVVVDFSAYPVGSTVDLVNDLGAGSTRDVMRFRIARRATGTPAVPNRLVATETLDPRRAVRTRDWRFRRGSPDAGPTWVINGRGFDPDRMDAQPRLGDVEIWRFSTDLRHPIHVHLDPFQILSRSGKPPSQYDKGWKDTVDVAPHEIVEVAVRFADHAGRYLLHCHTLEHEDMGMMAAFRTG